MSRIRHTPCSGPVTPPRPDASQKLLAHDAAVLGASGALRFAIQTVRGHGDYAGLALLPPARAVWYDHDMAHKTKTRKRDHGKGESHMVRLGARGRVVLPAAVRRLMNVSEGDSLLFLVDQDGVKLASLRDQVRGARGLYRHLGPGLVRELLRGRAEDANAE